MVLHNIIVTVTEDEYLVLLDVQEGMYHKTMSDTITTIVKDYIEKNWAEVPEEEEDD